MTRTWHAIGDPQTTFERFLDVLRRNGVLGTNGRLRDDVGLVSIGDHYDFKSDESLAAVGEHGSRILEWLAEHPPEQVVILMGNHDAARVMELAFESDDTFARAREEAVKCVASTADDDALARFRAAFPRMPAPGVVQRDYSAFTVRQRRLVQDLLMSGRMRLACAGHRKGRPVLLTHAGISETQRKELGVVGPEALAQALDARLRQAVDRVSAAWQRQELAALDLEPLHVAGREGREGGGLLYHRPSRDPVYRGNNPPLAPRRFDPSALPRDLVQVCGHTGHKKCVDDFKDWSTPDAKARERGGLRTLAVGPAGVTYHGSEVEPRDGDATMYLIDIEMNSDSETYPLFGLDRVST